MKEGTAREMLQSLARPENVRLPAWDRVRMRANYEDRIAGLRSRFRRLFLIEMAVIAVIGFSVWILALWGIFV